MKKNYGFLGLTIILILFIFLTSCPEVNNSINNTNEEKEKNNPLPSFPTGWVDSPYVTPDESALYFMHSVADIVDVLNQNDNAQPVAEYLPGHHGQNGTYWWNPDIYVSYKNSDDTWSWPENLGDNINTYHIEHCVWVSDDQKTIIFVRDAVDGNTILTGNYVATRDSTDDAWGVPEKLPDNIGDYLNNKYANLHMTPSGNIYLEGEASGNCNLYFAEKISESDWADPVELLVLNSTQDDDTQLWINDTELKMYYNRRDASGDTILLCSIRDTTADSWIDPIEIDLSGFENEYGIKIWGEPSFNLDETKMYFVKGLETYLYMASKDGNAYSSPEKIIFKK